MGLSFDTYFSLKRGLGSFNLGMTSGFSGKMSGTILVGVGQLNAQFIGSQT